MKNVFYLLFCLLLVNCKAQNTEFQTYINNFGKSTLPILIFDNQAYNAIFNQRYDSVFHGTYKEIPEKLVEKFICNDNFCNSNAGYFRYDYGVKLDYSKDFTAVLAKKQKFEGANADDFDLTEMILITYNIKGQTLSRKVICKDNDRWKSKVKICKDSIFVQQIKIIDDTKTNTNSALRCEVWTSNYQITKDGIIKLVNKSPTKIGIVIWDEKLEDYKIIESSKP